MPSRRTELICLVFFALTVSSINGSGYVDIALSTETSKPSTIGCCGSTSNATTCECQLTIRVCLLSYQSLGDIGSVDFSESCLLGFREANLEWEGSTNSFRRIGSHSESDSVLSIPFTFTWPGSTKVAFRVLQRGNDGREQIIQQTVQALVVNSTTPEWTEIQNSDDKDTVESLASLRFRVKVRCADFQYGPFCDIRCEPQDGPQGHFECDGNGNRRCLPGWKNLANRCRDAICALGCKNGTCEVPGECKCAHGWTGPKCDVCIPRPGCVHGYCIDKFECICEERWGGSLCSDDLDYCHHKQPCRNGAYCVPSRNNYTCECPPGFIGRDCEIEVNPCWNSPCQNFGTCVVKSETEYVCVCGVFHTGRNCESLLAGNGPVDPCHVNGQYYDHGQKWEMSGCRRCQCFDGSANCTKAMCQTGDCLLPGNPCPDGQHCSPVAPDPWSCLHAPCPARTYGTCVPNDFDESVALQRHVTCNRSTANHCDQFMLSLNGSSLPAGTYAADICYHLLVFVFERRFSQYHATCTTSRAAPGMVRVQVVSLKDQWPAADFRKVLQEAFLHHRGSFRSPLLQAIAAIDDVKIPLDSPENATQVSIWTDTGNRVLVASIVTVGVLICILTLVAFFLCRRMRSPQFRKPPPQLDSEKLPTTAVDVHLNNWTDRRKQCNILAAACGPRPPKEVNYTVKPYSRSPSDNEAKRKLEKYPDVVVDASGSGKLACSHVVHGNGSDYSSRSAEDGAKTRLKTTMVTLEASV